MTASHQLRCMPGTSPLKHQHPFGQTPAGRLHNPPHAHHRTHHSLASHHGCRKRAAPGAACSGVGGRTHSGHLRAASGPHTARLAASCASSQHSSHACAQRRTALTSLAQSNVLRPNMLQRRRLTCTASAPCLRNLLPMVTPPTWRQHYPERGHSRSNLRMLVLAVGRSHHLGRGQVSLRSVAPMGDSLLRSSQEDLDSARDVGSENWSDADDADSTDPSTWSWDPPHEQQGATSWRQHTVSSDGMGTVTSAEVVTEDGSIVQRQPVVDATDSGSCSSSSSSSNSSFHQRIGISHSEVASLLRGPGTDVEAVYEMLLALELEPDALIVCTRKLQSLLRGRITHAERQAGRRALRVLTDQLYNHVGQLSLGQATFAAVALPCMKRALQGLPGSPALWQPLPREPHRSQNFPGQVPEVQPSSRAAPPPGSPSSQESIDRNGERSAQASYPSSCPSYGSQPVFWDGEGAGVRWQQAAGGRWGEQQSMRYVEERVDRYVRTLLGRTQPHLARVKNKVLADLAWEVAQAYQQGFNSTSWWMSLLELLSSEERRGSMTGGQLVRLLWAVAHVVRITRTRQQSGAESRPVHENDSSSGTSTTSTRNNDSSSGSDSGNSSSTSRNGSSSSSSSSYNIRSKDSTGGPPATTSDSATIDVEPTSQPAPGVLGSDTDAQYDALCKCGKMIISTLVKRPIEEMQTADLAALHWSATVLGLHAKLGRSWYRRFEHVTTFRMLRQFNAPVLSSLVASMAQSGRTPTVDWSTVMMEVVVAHSETLSARQLTSIVKSYGRMHIPIPFKLVVLLLDQYCQLLPNASIADSANLLWALPHVSHPLSKVLGDAHPMYLQEITKSVQPHLPKCTPWQLGQLVSGIAGCRYYPGAQWMKEHREACLKSRGTFSDLDRRRVRMSYQIILFQD